MSFVTGIAIEWLDFFSYRAAAAENERFHSALAERAAVKRTCCLNSRGTKASIRLRKRMALARSITLVESTNSVHRGEADLLLTQLLNSKQENLANGGNNTYLRVGIAGPPGAGKSSFIETFGSFLLNGENDKDKKDTSFHPDKLAVVCIDPSSTVTGRSILGDKNGNDEPKST